MFNGHSFCTHSVNIICVLTSLYVFVCVCACVCQCVLETTGWCLVSSFTAHLAFVKLGLSLNLEVLI